MDLSQHNNDSETLPNELLEQILTEAWLSPMAPSQRASFVTTIYQASKLWSATLARIAAKYVYLPSSLLSDHWWSFEEWVPSLQHGLEELSTQASHPSTSQIAMSLKIGDDTLSSFDRLRHTAIRELFVVFQALSYIPSLRQFIIEYFNRTGLKTSLTFRFLVIHMEVEYTFPTDTPRWLVEKLGLTGMAKQGTPRHAPWDLPNIYQISTPTSKSACLGDVLALLPHLEPSDETFDIKVKILSTPQGGLPYQGFLLHGPLSSPCGPIRREGGTSGSLVTRGKALSILLDVGPPISWSQDLANVAREVHVLKQRSP